MDSDEPVSQLHKCAFEFKNNPSKFVYLSLSNERIIGITVKLYQSINKINKRFYYFRVNHLSTIVFMLILMTQHVGQLYQLIKQNIHGLKLEVPFHIQLHLLQLLDL